MPIVYKTNILDELKKSGYSSYRLRNEKLLSESTMSKLRNNNSTLTLENLSTICSLLNCQPGDIIEYIPDEIE